MMSDPAEFDFNATPGKLNPIVFGFSVLRDAFIFEWEKTPPLACYWVSFFIAPGFYSRLLYFTVMFGTFSSVDVGMEPLGLVLMLLCG